MTELADRRIDTTMVGQLAAQLRADAIRASTAAGSGHPTSSMSAADLMAVLLARHLRYDWNQPDHPDNDHFILSKGTLPHCYTPRSRQSVSSPTPN